MTEGSPLPFVGDAYREIHASVTRSLSRHDALIVLTGDSGVGKTTVWRSVVEQTTGAAASAILNPFLKFPDLLEQVLVDFGLASGRLTDEQDLRLIASEHDQIRSIHRFVENASGPAILVVDDAHLMNPLVLSQLRALINLSANARGLTVLLVGQPPLEETLRRPEFRSIEERVVLRWRLGSLSKVEVPAYIAHCYPDLDTPPDDVLDTLAAMSGGIPSAINRLVAAAAPAASTAGRRQVDAAAVRQAAQFVRAEAVSARTRSVRTGIVAAASIALAAAWLGARLGPAPPPDSAPTTLVAPTAPAAAQAAAPVALPLTPDARYAALRESASQRADELATRGEVTALLALRADAVEREGKLGAARPELVSALLDEIDAKIAEARAMRLRLDAEEFRRQSGP